MAKKRAHKSKTKRTLAAKPKQRAPKSKGQKRPKGEMYKLGGTKMKGHGTVDKPPLKTAGIVITSPHTQQSED